MTKAFSTILVVLGLGLLFEPNSLFAQSSISDAPEFRSNVVDTIFGVPVPDPYRWLESLNSDSTQQWLKQQRVITRKEKARFGGRYIGIYNKIWEDGGIEITNWIKEGPYYFRYKYIPRIGTNAYSSTPGLYYADKLNDEMLLCDPNIYSMKDIISIKGFSVSQDGKYVAVLLAREGSDWCEAKVIRIVNQKELSDKIEWVKFSNVHWWNNGFFYSRFKDPPAEGKHTDPNTRQQLYFHELGQIQSEDKLVYSIPDQANTVFNFKITSDKAYLVLNTVSKVKGEWCNVVGYKNLADGLYSDLKLLTVTPVRMNIEFRVVDFINGKFVVQTNLDAPHYKVLLFDKDSLNHAEDFIPQFKEILKWIKPVNHELLGLYYGNGTYRLAVFSYEGKLLSTSPMDTGYIVGGFYGDPDDSVVLFTRSSFYYPPVVFKLNLSSKRTELFEKTTVHYNPQGYTTSIEIFKSKDGTEIPMYLTYKKGLKLSNNNPVILYGYGGFGISMTPFFSFANIIFFENNGILAVPLIRGGGEFGQEWHDAGKRMNKQNSFDDFIAAAEYLIEKGYTSKEHLAIRGGSNGGLLIGAMLNQRPDLFKVAIGEMGVYDMIRYPLFSGGRFLQEEYGNPDDSVEFRNLLKYSPYHNVKNKVDYPATLLVTAENDDRVPPFHSYKFLASLQENSLHQKPHIMYLEEDAGHGGPETFEYWVREDAFILAFIFTQLGLDLKTVF